MDTKLIIGIIGIIIGVAGYITYFRDIFRLKTKPHMFSWFIWALSPGIVFVSQIQNDAGIGAWITFISAAIPFFVFLLAFKYGEKEITKIDWISFILALLAIVLWVSTGEPLTAVILAIIVEVFSFVPTFRKSYYKPYEETLIHYELSVVKFGIGVFALDAYTLVNWLFPASLVLMSGSFVAMLIIRRHQLAMVA